MASGAVHSLPCVALGSVETTPIQYHVRGNISISRCDTACSQFAYHGRKQHKHRLPRDSLTEKMGESSLSWALTPSAPRGPRPETSRLYPTKWVFSGTGTSKDSSRRRGFKTSTIRYHIRIVALSLPYRVVVSRRAPTSRRVQPRGFHDCTHPRNGCALASPGEAWNSLGRILAARQGLRQDGKWPELRLERGKRRARQVCGHSKTRRC